MNASELATKFHNLYEKLAIEYGYQTRTETRDFDAESPNGRLMIRVCEVILNDHLAVLAENNNRIVQFGAIIDSIDMIVSNGKEPPDFMMSFSLVRAVWDIFAALAEKEQRFAILHEQMVIGFDQRDRALEQIPALQARIEELDKGTEVWREKKSRLENELAKAWDEIATLQQKEGGCG